MEKFLALSQEKQATIRNAALSSTILLNSSFNFFVSFTNLKKAPAYCVVYCKCGSGTNA